MEGSFRLPSIFKVTRISGSACVPVTAGVRREANGPVTGSAKDEVAVVPVHDGMLVPDTIREEAFLSVTHGRWDITFLR